MFAFLPAGSHLWYWDDRRLGNAMTISWTETIETTAGQAAAELMRRGIDSDRRVTIMIDPEEELIPGRREARARVVAAGLTDDDIDRMIKQAQKEVEPHPE